MEALTQLCDLISNNPTPNSSKIAWICKRCPQPESLLSGSPRVSRSQLNAVLATARFISQCPNYDDVSPRNTVLEFIRSIPSSFGQSFWPKAFAVSSIGSFYNEFLGYVVKAGELYQDFSTDVAGFMGGIVFAALDDGSNELGISRAFLAAMAESFPQIIPADANKLVTRLLDSYLGSCPSGSSGNVGVDGSSTPSGGDNKGVPNFKEEAMEMLEKQEIAFKLIERVLDKVQIDPGLLERVRLIAKEQLRIMTSFLKIRKYDWTEQGASLKARINLKLSVYKAAAKLKVKSHVSLDLDGKSSKKLLHGALALLVEAAEACLYSVWRRLRTCEDLFNSLLDGISKIAFTRGGHLLRVLLIRFKQLVLLTCAQAESSGNNQGAMFDSVLKTSCEIIEYGWTKDRTPVDTFIMGLATSIREQNDYEEKDAKEKAVPVVQLNVIRLLAQINVQVNKAEVVDTILPLFIENLEEGDASTPGLLRLRILDAVSRMASLGFEKSYREVVVLMMRSYLSKLSTIASAESNTLPEDANSERLETLPAGFELIARDLKNAQLRVDYRQRLLSLCSDVGLAAESKSGSCGADFLGPLLPAVAEICSDFDPTVDVEPSLQKLFRNLWFYIALFGLAPPVVESSKSHSTTSSSAGSTTAISIQAVNGPYMWSPHWCSAVKRISQGTPPLVVSSVKWLEDELELNALHNPGSRRGSGNEKAAASQRAALSAALGGRVEVWTMSTISGVKATYLLAVAFLEIIRFSSNGGLLNCSPNSTASRSAFSCAFEYLKSPNLVPAVFQCLMAVVHRAFETALSWLEDQVYETGYPLDVRESTLGVHACFLIKSLSQRDEHVREVSVKLLSQLRDSFPQILWNSCCLDNLLFSVQNDPPSAIVSDPAWISSVRSLYQKIVREWIIISLSHAPCTSQGLLQEKLCKANMWQRAQPTTDVVSLLSEIRIGPGKSDCWSGTKTANIPAVMAAAAASSGGNLKLTEAFNLEVLSTAIVSATVKCNHSGEIAGMTRLYENMEKADDDIEGSSSPGPGSGSGPAQSSFSRLISGAFPQPPQPKKESFGSILLNKFVRLIQKFVITAEKGGDVDKSSFRETCSQAAALVLSTLDSDSKTNVESFSQLLRLLCWCPAYISTIDAMETGIFIWTWLVSAAPQLGPVVLAELVDAWLWTIDTKRGLFASDVRYSGPAAKLRPHLSPGEPQSPPETDPVQQIQAHKLWIGFFIDRFEVVQHDSIVQLLLLGRMLQATTKLPWKFSRHPAAAGTFFTVMLFGLKFCSCKYRGRLQKVRMGLQLLEDGIYRASLGWFAHEPEWFESDHGNFAHSEAQSLSSFVQFLLNQQYDTRIGEHGNSLIDMDHCHPVWGLMENYAIDREKRKQLLLMLCQHEADRLEVWAQPVSSKESTNSRSRIGSEKWVEYTRTAFAVDPRIAFSLGARFPANPNIKAEITQLVQTHILEIRNIPEALPYFVTPKAVDENSPLLQQLPYWAACSITQAIEFFTPAYKGHPRVMAYALRVLESYPPSKVTFFMPQLIQALRYDDEMLIEGYLLRATQRSDVFAHILIWQLQGETCEPEQSKEAVSAKTQAFLALLPVVREHIIDGFGPEARDVFHREFDFFEKVTSISGVLYPLPKEERRDGIRRELEKIQLPGDDLYLPTAPNKLVKGIQVNSGIPLQSAAKVPIMITFDVADRDGDPKDIKPQACIFKVGDDCRQDVLALQVISLLKDIFDAVGLGLYLYPYGVLPTDPERGIIEVVPNSRSRSQMGETTDGGLYEIFQQDFGPVGSPAFETARENFIVSSAGYAVASLLLQPKDRHNGNLLIDNEGRLVHIDFGFIFEISPGGNMRFESAHFKLSHEMTQLLDPSGAMKSDTWHLFESLCVKGYLNARRHMNGIINTVLLMVESGLPCFSRGDPIGNLRKRFRPEMSEREAANHMIHICADAYNKWTTAGYDLIQYLQQGIEK
ncbi:putative 1-phosphatidylinositol 4-kinase [Helianthus annuus]|uniref:1-phosphatidylinositol 4-kinase n=1 Tax=Helianthus annuus TaxID=4232 RepID=A0A251TQC8_HELAN|nr:phosphatidylinositol 4-kinase alpha 1 isoform X2 [Helianthus annuus]KAF5787480.1 putative 1-phosphatidylinositol 4-kinase [Helianthus annuus]KAJ0880694.1 putative 1-phosphatidylinositol 4-kinase [Helianthus annuus]